jgi:hypothetical protein
VSAWIDLPRGRKFFSGSMLDAPHPQSYIPRAFRVPK